LLVFFYQKNSYKLLTFHRVKKNPSHKFLSPRKQSVTGNHIPLKSIAIFKKKLYFIKDLTDLFKKIPLK